MQVVISNSIVLNSITLEDYAILYELMEKIYPPAYNYLWRDNGEWYLHEIYGKKQVAKDLEDKHSSFYFQAKG